MQFRKFPKVDKIHNFFVFQLSDHKNLGIDTHTKECYNGSTKNYSRGYGIMKKEDNAPITLNLDSFLIRTAHKNKDLMQNLKAHLQFLEDKHDLKARKAMATSLCAGITATTISAATGLSYFLDQTTSIVADIPSLTGCGAIAGVGVVTTAIAGIIAHNQNKKAKKYRYFRQLSEAGLEDSTQLEKTKEIIENNGTLEDIKEEIMPKRYRYVGLQGNFYADDIYSTPKKEDKNQLSFEI